MADTRTEADFVAFLEALIASAVPTINWRIVCDNLDIHMSEGVVRHFIDAALAGHQAPPARIPLWRSHSRIRTPLALPAGDRLRNPDGPSPAVALDRL